MAFVLFSGLWLKNWCFFLLRKTERKMTVKMSNEHVQWHVIEITKTNQAKKRKVVMVFGVWCLVLEDVRCKDVPHSGHVWVKELHIFLYDGEDWSKFQSSSNLCLSLQTEQNKILWTTSRLLESNCRRFADM
jgi:hypothetical protein